VRFPGTLKPVFDVKVNVPPLKVRSVRPLIVPLCVYVFDGQVVEAFVCHVPEFMKFGAPDIDENPAVLRIPPLAIVSVELDVPFVNAVAMVRVCPLEIYGVPEFEAVKFANVCPAIVLVYLEVLLLELSTKRSP
jgi:hypothetical protein